MAAKTIFELIDCLTIHKSDWEDTPDFSKNYNQYLVNKFLGLQDMFLPIISELNLTKDLPDEVHYNLLKMYLPKKKVYLKFIKKDKEDVTALNAISSYFNISVDESREIIDFLDESDIDYLIELLEEPKVIKKKKR